MKTTKESVECLVDALKGSSPVKVMLILKLCAALAVIGVMLFTPFLMSILTVGIFYFVTMNGVVAAKVAAGFGRALLMLIGCGVQWLVMSFLFEEADLLRTGLIYLGLVLIFGVPLDALEDICLLFKRIGARRCTLGKHQSCDPEIMDAEIVDDTDEENGDNQLQS